MSYFRQVHGKGASGYGLYGLLKGEIRISASTIAGEAILLTRLLPGQWFGEIAILDGGPRTHDAHTVVKSDIAVLPKQAILNLCHRDDTVYRTLVALLCTHCRMAFAAIDEFLVYSPEQRIARRLVEHKARTGNERIVISQESLGALVGISRQSTNQIQKRWESRHWIKRAYGGVTLCDLDALQKLANYIL